MYMLPDEMTIDFNVFSSFMELGLQQNEELFDYHNAKVWIRCKGLEDLLTDCAAKVFH